MMFATGLMLAATLCAGGKSEYTLVPGTNGVYDVGPAEDFQEIFARSTGVSLPILTNGVGAVAGHRIFIGVSPAAEKVFGRETLGHLVAKCTEKKGFLGFGGGDLYLRGGGNEGTGFAVHHFLEECLGYRYYAQHPDSEKIVKTDRVETDGRELVRDVSFKFGRSLMHTFISYHPQCEVFQWRNGATPRGKYYSRKDLFHRLDGYWEDVPHQDGGHGFNLYITDKSHMKYYPWKEPCDYWATHPEWFTLGKDGKRVNFQLCFSNAELRKEFTRRVLERCETVGGKGSLTIGANDFPGTFCYCNDCLAREKKYGTPAGAFYEYLRELMTVLEERFPDIWVKSLAYRKEQTERCPKDFGTMPGNFICDFAQVADTIAQPIGGKGNEETYENLKKWRKISKKVASWVYACTSTEPYGPVSRIQKELKALKAAGVDEVGLCGKTSPSVYPLHEYLFLRLAQDVNCDVWREVRGFCDFMFGPAADEAYEFYQDCDKAWFKDQPYTSIDGGNILVFDEYLLKWQLLAEKAERKLKPGSPAAKHFEWIRWDIDYLTLRDWPAFQRLRPPKEMTPETIYARAKNLDIPFKFYGYRLNPISKKMEGHYLRLETVYLCAKAADKPIPAPLDKLPREQVKVLPQCGKAFPCDDPDAICGRASGQPIKDICAAGGTTIGYNYYDSAEKHELHAYEKDPPLRPIVKKIDFSKATHGKYELYFLGKIRLTRGATINIGNWWGIGAPLGGYWQEGDPNREFELWGSFKFCGSHFRVPSPVEGNYDRILCDAFYLVDRNGSAYQERK